MWGIAQGFFLLFFKCFFFRYPSSRARRFRKFIKTWKTWHGYLRILAMHESQIIPLVHFIWYFYQWIIVLKNAFQIIISEYFFLSDVFFLHQSIGHSKNQLTMALASCIASILNTFYTHGNRSFISSGLNIANNNKW